jgi:hypothetical protein
MLDMSRRKAFSLFGGAATWPLAAHAQQSQECLVSAPRWFQTSGVRFRVGH